MTEENQANYSAFDKIVREMFKCNKLSKCEETISVVLKLGFSGVYGPSASKGGDPDLLHNKRSKLHVTL